MASAGVDLEPWQAGLLDDGLAEADDGRWAAGEVACWVPRQNGKGAVLEAVALVKLFLLGSRQIIWSAHEDKTAENGFHRLEQLIERSPHLRRRLKKIIHTNGKQRITLRDGRHVQFNTRSKKALRGFTADDLLLDEAQELTDAQMAAIMSTLSARSADVPGVQLWYFGTPPDSPLAWCYSVKASGEAGEPDLVWHDFGLHLDPGEDGRYAEEDLADVDRWYQANPALGVRISEAFVGKELRRLRQLFAGERLGVWPPAVDIAGKALSASEWAARQRPAPLPPGDRLVLSLDAWGERWAIGRSWSVPGEGVTAVELAAEGVDLRLGVEHLLVLEAQLDPAAVLVDTYGPAAAVVPDLRRSGVRNLVTPDSRQVVDAWTRFHDDVHHGRLIHPGALDGGNQALELAVDGAVTRRVGERVVLHRAASNEWVHALMAVVLARWGVATTLGADPIMIAT